MGPAARLRAYGERASWGEAGYALARLPVGVVTLVVTFFMWALAVVMTRCRCTAARCRKAAWSSAGPCCAAAGAGRLRCGRHPAALGRACADPWTGDGGRRALTRLLLAPSADMVLAARAAELERGPTSRKVAFPLVSRHRTPPRPKGSENVL